MRSPAMLDALIVRLPCRMSSLRVRPVQSIDLQGYVRWPPHCNLLYPFLEDCGSTFEAAAQAAAEALQSVKPFQVPQVLRWCCVTEVRSCAGALPR